MILLILGLKSRSKFETSFVTKLNKRDCLLVDEFFLPELSFRRQENLVRVQRYEEILFCVSCYHTPGAPVSSSSLVILISSSGLSVR